MSFDNGEEVVKNGTFLYDDTVLCAVRIVYSTICYGSGDWEDPPELAEDQHGEFFGVQWGSTTVRGLFNAASGGGTTIQEAIAAAESMPGVGKTIVWIDRRSTANSRRWTKRNLPRMFTKISIKATMLSKRYAPLDFDSPLTPEADRLLAEAVAEFDEKQQRLRGEWRIDSHVRSEFNPENATLRLDFADGSAWQADAQLIGTFCVSDASFEWAWNNPRFPNNITHDSYKVRTGGEELGLAYLRKGMIPIKDGEFLSYLCAIAIKVTNADGVFRGGGDDVHTLFTIRNQAWGS